tara:strand:+ start:1229 stop:2161 length:933 start_codon:yes stop_codon:yes gene_type:complete
MPRRKKSKFQKFLDKARKSYLKDMNKFMESKNGVILFALSILLGIFFGLVSLTETKYQMPIDTPPVLGDGPFYQGNVTPNKFESFTELQLRLVERTEDFCRESQGRLVAFAPDRNMTIRQILNRQIIDTDLDNPFVWVSVDREYERNNDKLSIVANHPDLPAEDQAQQRSQFLTDLPTFYEVDPTQPVFLTSFYYQHFEGVKDFIERDDVVFKGQMIVFQFRDPVKFCRMEFTENSQALIKGAGWNVGAFNAQGDFSDEMFIDPEYLPFMEVEEVFKTNLFNNSEINRDFQTFEPGFYWVKTKFKHTVEN